MADTTKVGDIVMIMDPINYCSLLSPFLWRVIGFEDDTTAHLKRVDPLSSGRTLPILIICLRKVL